MENEGKATDLFDLTGHVAVITGGGRGIGEGIAKSFQMRAPLLWWQQEERMK